MELFKEYTSEDYVFTDENGQKYISTPEADWMGCISAIVIICFLGMAGVASVLYVSFSV